MALISNFDPWHSPLCTCPSKLTFNPYTGCDHHCIYCYASSYISNSSECRPKKDLIARLAKEASRLKGEILSMSSSSDPYPTIEAEYCLTRQCLGILKTNDCKIQITTKSPLVTRDIDILAEMKAMVSMTITTENDEIARLIEPDAPASTDRLRAVRTLISNGIPTSVRIDPVLPFVNENQDGLVDMLASLNVKHITASTCKMKQDSWIRIKRAVPDIAAKLRPLYFELGQRIGRSYYLPKEIRCEIMSNLQLAATTSGIKFATCREDSRYLNTAICDGSWLLNS